MNVVVAGVGSMLPCGSTAWTRSVCGPGAPPGLYGDAQGTKAAPSSEHWKVEPASEAVSVNGGAEPLMLVSGRGSNS